jgi:hypothetical protein
MEDRGRENERKRSPGIVCSSSFPSISFLNWLMLGRRQAAAGGQNSMQHATPSRFVAAVSAFGTPSQAHAGKALAECVLHMPLSPSKVVGVA